MSQNRSTETMSDDRTTKFLRRRRAQLARWEERRPEAPPPREHALIDFALAAREALGYSRVHLRADESEAGVIVAGRVAEAKIEPEGQ